MVVTKITGGLGNQLFQLAFSLKLANLNKKEISLDTSFYFDKDDRSYMLKELGFLYTELTPEEIQKITLETSKKHGFFRRSFIRKGNSIEIDEYTIENVESVMRKNYTNYNIIYVKGYWQYQNYANEVIDQLRKNINSRKVSLNQTFPGILEENSIALHIRRGDYCKIKSGLSGYSIALSDEYYLNAINSIKNKFQGDLKFYIFSDEPSKVTSAIRDGINHVLVDMKDPIQEFSAMALCKHHIISNSTFSYWSAMVFDTENSINITPRNWFGSDSGLPEKRIIPEKWLSIPASFSPLIQ